MSTARGKQKEGRRRETTYNIPQRQVVHVHSRDTLMESGDVVLSPTFIDMSKFSDKKFSVQECKFDFESWLILPACGEAV